MTERFMTLADIAADEINKMSREQMLKEGCICVANVEKYLATKGLSENNTRKFIYAFSWFIIGADRSYSEVEHEYLKDVLGLSCSQSTGRDLLKDAFEEYDEERFGSLISDADEDSFGFMATYAILMVAVDREITYSEKERLFNLMTINK